MWGEWIEGAGVGEGATQGGYRRTRVRAVRSTYARGAGTPGTGNSHSYSFHGTLVHYFHAYMHARRCTRSRDETNRGNEIFYAPEYALYTPAYPAELLPTR